MLYYVNLYELINFVKGESMRNILNSKDEVADFIRESFKATDGESSLPFKVLKMPMTGPDGLESPEFGLWRSDTWDYVSSKSVRSGYNPHQTSDVVQLGIAATESFDVPVSVDCHFQGGHYITILPTKEFRRSIYGTSDNVFPRFQISAIYGSGGFQASLGIYRDVCSNMAMLKSVTSTTTMIRHDSNFSENYDSLLAQFSCLRERWGTVADACEQMESIKVNLKDFYNFMFPISESDSARKKSAHEKMITKIHSRLLRERFETGRDSQVLDSPVSGWEAWNAITGYVQHDKRRKKNPTFFERVISANRDSMCQKAEEYIFSLAS